MRFSSLRFASYVGDVGLTRPARPIDSDVHANTPAERPLPPVRMTPGDPFGTLQTFRLSSGAEGRFYSLAALDGEGLGPISRLPVSASASCSSRVLRNLDGKRIKEERRPGPGRLEGPRGAHGGGTVRRRADRPAGLHRRAAARGSRGDAVRRASGWARTRSSSSPSCRSPSSSITPSRWTTGPRPTPCAEHGDRVPPQPRAIRVPEVGHAGVPRLRGRPAGHRHRPPGQSRVPRAGRASRGTASTTPTRSSAPIRTRR